MKFNDLLNKTVPIDKLFPGLLLTFDPGEATGACLFDCILPNKPAMIYHGQFTSAPVEYGAKEIESRIVKFRPSTVLYERYLVYSWKSAAHSWDVLHTPQLIGAIKTICTQQNIPTRSQMAQHAKEFCTDDKLKEWNYYIKGQRHTRDAIRHALYFLLFQHTKQTLE